MQSDECEAISGWFRGFVADVGTAHFADLAEARAWVEWRSQVKR